MGWEQEPLQAAQVHSFPGTLIGWEILCYLGKLIKDTWFTLGEIHSPGRWEGKEVRVLLAELLKKLTLSLPWYRLPW